MTEPLKQLRIHRRAVAEAARRQGVRETARRAGCNPMVVSRFISGHEGQRCDHFYLIAAACGFAVMLGHERTGRPVKAGRKL